MGLGGGCKFVIAPPFQKKGGAPVPLHPHMLWACWRMWLRLGIVVVGLPSLGLLYLAGWLVHHTNLETLFQQNFDGIPQELF